MVTILGLLVDLLGLAGDPQGMVGRHLWQLSPGISFVSKVPNSLSIVHFHQVGGHPKVGG